MATMNLGLNESTLIIVKHILEAYVDAVGCEQNRREKKSACRTYRQPERITKVPKQKEMIVFGHEQTKRADY